MEGSATNQATDYCNRLTSGNAVWFMQHLYLQKFLARNGAFSALMLLVGRQEGHSACKKTQWWGAGVVICLEQGADLHTAQLMPMPLAVSCFSKMQIGLPFWYRLTQVVLDKGLLNGCVCVFSKKRGRHDFIF